MSDALTPCPFCGWRANLARIISPEGEARGERPSWDIDCTGCGMWRRFDSEAEATTKWNQRPAPAEARSVGAPTQSYAEAVKAYNAVFDPAFEAGQEVFNAGFREGWMFAVYPDGPDGYEEAAENFSRSVDGVELGEAWDAHRDAFFARLPLAALPALPTPPKA